jgi:thiol-disulfide isomerase/thioredoxin
LKAFLLALALLANTTGVLASELDDHAWKIVNYWSKTCAPCRIEIPELNHLNEALESLGVDVLGVNFDDHDREQTMEIAARMGIQFPTLTRAEVETLNLTPPSVLPTTYLLDPDNNVKAKLVGAQDRNMMLTKLAELGVGK